METPGSQNKLQQLTQKVLNFPNFKKTAWATSALLAGVIVLTISISHLFYVSTDDAYINTDIVHIAPQVSGKILNLNIVNNQTVKKGQLLFEIDPTPYLIAVDKAKSELALARREVAEKKASVDAAKAQVALRFAEWQAAKSLNERTMKLVKRRVIAQQAGDDVTASFEKSIAALDAAKANLLRAEIDLGKNDDSNEQIVLAKANLDNAQLNLSYTKIWAPNAGTIANLTQRKGSLVTQNEPLFALISTGNYWVDTNLKETDLKNIRIGQKATVKVDMYPDHAFKGIVESISGGSGATFSLLPPQNATGNWVKITQRVPVRVRILENNKKYPLRVGTSANVRINT